MVSAITEPTIQATPAGINAHRNEPVASLTNPPRRGPTIPAIPYAVKTNG